MNIQARKKTSALLGYLLLSVVWGAPGHLWADDSGWDYAASIYMWGPSITMTTPKGQQGELPFYQILDDLQLAVMGDFSARKEKWSFATDLIYMDLKQSDERDFDGPAGRERNLVGTVQMKSWIVTSTAGYAIHDDEKALVEVVGGVRYLWLKSAIRITEDGNPVFNESASDSFWDGVIGMRAAFNLNENWYIPAYFDVGAGNSDGTWQALGGVGYRWKRYEASLVYRYLKYSFDDVSTLSKMVVKGPLMKFTFNF